MFETKEGQDYALFNNINSDSMTWKKYNSSLIWN